MGKPICPIITLGPHILALRAQIPEFIWGPGPDCRPTGHAIYNPLAHGSVGGVCKCATNTARERLSAARARPECTLTQFSNNNLQIAYFDNPHRPQSDVPLRQRCITEKGVSTWVRCGGMTVATYVEITRESWMVMVAVNILNLFLCIRTVSQSESQRAALMTHSQERCTSLESNA